MSALPEVHGKCPECGGTSLFVGEGGRITCSLISCPNPAAADELLSNPGLVKATYDALVERNARLDRIERIAKGEVGA